MVNMPSFLPSSAMASRTSGYWPGLFETLMQSAPSLLELAHHRARLVGRVADVPVAQRQRPAQAEHESRRHHLVRLDCFRCSAMRADAGAGAGVAHGGDAVAEVEPVG